MRSFWCGEGPDQAGVHCDPERRGRQRVPGAVAEDLSDRGAATQSDEGSLRGSSRSGEPLGHRVTGRIETAADVLHLEQRGEESIKAPARG